MNVFNDAALVDARDVVVASTNASLFAYVADGTGGLKVLQLTFLRASPSFTVSPLPKPELIAYYPTQSPARLVVEGSRPRPCQSTSRGTRSPSSDDAGRPRSLQDSQRLYLNPDGTPWVRRKGSVRPRTAGTKVGPLAPALGAAAFGWAVPFSAQDSRGSRHAAALPSD